MSSVLSTTEPSLTSLGSAPPLLLTVVQNEVQVKQNISLAVHTSSETSVRYVSETVDEKIWHWDLLESWKNMAFLVFFGVFGCHFHSAVLFPQVFGTAYDIYPPQTSA